MFRVLSGLFRASSKRRTRTSTLTLMDRAGMTVPEQRRSHGYRFNATMALCTPLRVLEKHGEEHPGPVSALPQYSDGQDGLWQHRLGSWNELGDVAKEIENRMASAVGSIPRDGGEFLRFLKGFREIVESGDTQQQILYRTQGLIEGNATFKQFARKLHLNSADRVLRYLDREFDGFPCGQILNRAGYRSRAEVKRASDAELLAIRGIGKSRLRLIRAVLSPLNFKRDSEALPPAAPERNAGADQNGESQRRSLA